MNHYKIFIDSAQWECSTNLINCSKLHRYLEENTHIIVQKPEESDYIIINSCGVTDRGKNFSINLVQKYLNLKEKHPSIILFGCLVDIDRQMVNSLNVTAIGFQDIRLLDTIFFQKKRFEEIKPYCNDKLRELLLKGTNSTSIKPAKNPIKFMLIEVHLLVLSFPLIMISRRAKEIYHRMINQHSHCIFIEISKGCTGNCNYCLIKKAKGQIHSREIQDILKDISLLYDPTKELNLVADDCGCYGVDKGSSIVQLLDDIYENFPALRLRINYLDPQYFLKYSEDFIRILQTMEITTLMIPLQSGSQTVLKKMNRTYDVTKIIEVINRVKKVSPHTMIFTHFIVGHPGESWSDYRKSLEVSRFFDYTVPFEYSNNKGTVSAEMTGHISRPVSLLRYAIFLFYLNVLMLFKITDSLKNGK
jgi:tRNA A37 methylthiotransferase MiaB